MKQMLAEGQRLNAEFNTETQDVWRAIQLETGIDLMTSDWAPSAEEQDTIVMIQKRFFPGK